MSSKTFVFSTLIALGHLPRRNPLPLFLRRQPSRGIFFNHIRDSHYVRHYLLVTPIFHTCFATVLGRAGL